MKHKGEKALMTVLAEFANLVEEQFGASEKEVELLLTLAMVKADQRLDEQEATIKIPL